MQGVDKYKLAIIYANEALDLKVGSINKISKPLKGIDKVKEVKVYTAEKFRGKTKELFHKVIVLTDEPNSNFDIYRRSIYPEFAEYITEILIVSESSAGDTLPVVQGLNHMMTVQSLSVISTWWPSALRFFVRSQALENEAIQSACSFLFNDSDEAELKWFYNTSIAVQMFGLKCVRPGQPDYVAIKEGKGEKLRYQVILATGNGIPMLSKQQQDFGVNVGSFEKIICFTEDKKSEISKTVKSFKDVDVKIREIKEGCQFGYKDWVVLLKKLKLLEVECSDDDDDDNVDVWKIVLVVVLVILLLPLVGGLIFLYICFGVDLLPLFDCCDLTRLLCICGFCAAGNAVSHFDD